MFSNILLKELDRFRNNSYLHQLWERLIDTRVLQFVVIGSMYGIVDAGIGGAIFAWLYNFISE